MEERNVSRKGISPKHDLTSAKDLRIEHLEERESTYHTLN